MPWQLLPNHAQVLAVHAAYMGFGQILYFGGDEHDPVHNEKKLFNATCLFNCGSSTVTKIASPNFDVFCSGHAFLGASNIVKLLVAGGTEQFDKHAAGLHHPHFPGLKDAAVFSSPDFIVPTTGGWDWAKVAPMAPGLLTAPSAELPHPDPKLTGGRWYPTLITLGNGSVIAFSGHPGSSDGSNSPAAEHNNCIPEIFTREPQPKGGWRRLANYSNSADRDYYERHAMTNYPRMHLLPTGEILCTNPVRERTFAFQPDVGPNGGTFNALCMFMQDEGDNNKKQEVIQAFGGYQGTSVLLPLRHNDPDGAWEARAMICGGATDTAYLLARKSLPVLGKQWNWRRTGARRMREHRVNANVVILPTGEILLCGGVDAKLGDATPDKRGVLMPELYNPYDDTWEIGDAPAKSVRNYHSVALLMPDGRVWTAGSNRDAGRGAGAPPAGNPDVRNLDIEIYEPWYAAHPGRPFINAAPSLAYPNETILVQSTFAKEISRVVLVRCSTSTHAFNPDQRMIELFFTNPVGDNLLVTMPPNNNILVPGPYLIFTIRRPSGSKGKVNALGLPSFGTDIYVVPERKKDRERPHR
jgi:hypothetical protein